jgi:hypothetical protein
MKRTILSLLLLGIFHSKAQFNFPVVDGTISANEYGNNAAGQNGSFTVDGRTYFLTWNDNNLYVATNNYVNGGDAAVLYLDIDPLDIVNGGTNADGNLTGTGYDGVSPTLPFRADVFLFVKEGYKDFVLANGNGWGTNNGNSPLMSSVYSDANDVLEFSIPWNAITLGTRPAAFNFLAFLSYAGGGGGTFARIPQENPAGVNALMSYYFTVTSTADASSDKPFSQKSYSQNTGFIDNIPTNTFFDFTVNNTSAVSLTRAIAISNALTVVNGSTITTNDSLTLLSTATRTARVNPLAGVINGRVNVERYIGIPVARRAWRLLTAPLTNAETIFNSWQNGGMNSPGRGTFITGPAATNGLDAGRNYSMKTFDVATQQLLNVTSTNQSLSFTSGNADNRGFFLFVRGDRNPANLTPPNANTTTLSALGSLQVGTHTFDASDIAGNFSLIGNPYAAPVDFDNVTRTNVTKRFYAWDPTLNAVGGYVLVDDINEDGLYDITPVSSSQTRIIGSGQAVFVQTLASAPANVTFNEISKSTMAGTAGFRTNSGKSETFRTNLYLKNPDNTTTLADGVLAAFNRGFVNEVSIAEDAVKMTNIDENLALERDGQALAIERRSLISDGDVLQLRLSNTSSREYQFEFVPANISSDLSATLEDRFLNTSAPISLIAPTTISFSVTTDPASADQNRFSVVFRTSATSPLNITTVKGWQKEDGIQVDWNVAIEKNVAYYEVEKSLNGNSFIKATEVSAKANNNNSASYNWVDANPVKGNNFYRIKVVERSGAVKYSEVVIVRLGSTKGEILVYPNPVKGKTIGLQFINKAAGTYTARLINHIGQQVFTRTLTHAGGSATQTIHLTAALARGVYLLQIINGVSASTQQLICK